MIFSHVLKSKEAQDEQIIRKVKEAVDLHANRAYEILKISDPVNVTVYPNAAWTIPETGENGYTPTGDWVQVSLDLTGTKHDISTVIDKRLPVVIYHEMAHIKRWQTTGFGSTFREELVSEGLACAFEAEQVEHDVEPVYAATEDEIQKFIAIVNEQKKRIKNEYSYSDWFIFGDEIIPKWLGYKLGFYVVIKALHAKSGLKVIDLIGVQAEEIIEMSGVEI